MSWFRLSLPVGGELRSRVATLEAKKEDPASSLPQHSPVLINKG
jgi:hypothetical protein